MNLTISQTDEKVQPKLNEGVIFRRDGEKNNIIIVKSSLGDIYFLNPMAAHILEMCSEQLTVKEMIVQLQEKRKVSQEQLCKEIVQTLGYFEKMYLITLTQNEN